MSAQSYGAQRLAASGGAYDPYSPYDPYTPNDPYNPARPYDPYGPGDPPATKAEAKADVSAEAIPAASRLALASTILKNLLFFGVVFGTWYAIETGYFSADRTLRSDWMEMERLKEKGKPVKAYEADFSRITLDGRGQPEGFWAFYNGATAPTVVVEGGNLVLSYSAPWIGSEFRHTAYEPRAVYRVTIEAKVEGEPAAILMRNRQLDLMRNPIPVSDGQFKTFTYHYVAPGGRLDQVRVIFMPDNRTEPKGKMTVRKFIIERLEG